jgi:hypothetical protein
VAIDREMQISEKGQKFQMKSTVRLFDGMQSGKAAGNRVNDSCRSLFIPLTP